MLVCYAMFTPYVSAFSSILFYFHQPTEHFPSRVVQCQGGLSSAMQWCVFGEQQLALWCPAMDTMLHATMHHDLCTV